MARHHQTLAAPVVSDQSLVVTDGGVFVLEPEGQSILDFQDFYESTTNPVQMAEKVDVLRLQQKIIAFHLLTRITLSQNLHVSNDLRGWLPNWVPRDYDKTFDATEVKTAHYLEQLSAGWRERRFCGIAGHDLSSRIRGVAWDWLKEVAASNALSSLFVKRRIQKLIDEEL